MVAVGCASKMKTGLARCSLQQFLEYLWAPQVGRDGKPKTGYPQGNVGDMSDYKWETADLTAIFNKIFKAGFTDGVRGNRLVRGATEFWPARRQVTVPIASLQGRIAEFSDPATATKMITKAKEANTAAYMMRLMDFEKYRIKGGSLNKELGDGRQVAIRNLDTGIRGFSFNALDAEATLAAFPDLTQADLQAACDRVRVLPMNINHWTALQAGRAALANGDCAARCRRYYALRNFLWWVLKIPWKVEGWKITKCC